MSTQITLTDFSKAIEPNENQWIKCNFFVRHLQGGNRYAVIGFISDYKMDEVFMDFKIENALSGKELAALRAYAKNDGKSFILKKHPDDFVFNISSTLYCMLQRVLNNGVFEYMIIPGDQLKFA